MSLQKRLFFLIFIASLSQITYTKPEDAQNMGEEINNLRTQREILQTKLIALKAQGDETIKRISNTVHAIAVGSAATIAYSIKTDATTSFLHKQLMKAAPHIAARLGIFALPISTPIAAVYITMFAGITLRGIYMDKYSKEETKNKNEQNTLTERIEELIAFNKNTNQ